MAPVCLVCVVWVHMPRGPEKREIFVLDPANPSKLRQKAKLSVASRCGNAASREPDRPAATLLASLVALWVLGHGRVGRLGMSSGFEGFRMSGLGVHCMSCAAWIGGEWCAKATKPQPNVHSESAHTVL